MTEVLIIALEKIHLAKGNFNGFWLKFSSKIIFLYEKMTESCGLSGEHEKEILTDKVGVSASGFLKYFSV